MRLVEIMCEEVWIKTKSLTLTFIHKHNSYTGERKWLSDTILRYHPFLFIHCQRWESSGAARDVSSFTLVIRRSPQLNVVITI